MGVSWVRRCRKQKKISQPGNDYPHTHTCDKTLKHNGPHHCPRCGHAW